MGKEIGAKFIDINKEEISRKLIELGAVKAFDERLLRRCVYNLPIKKDGAWARVRDEGEKVTMTYKRVTEKSLTGVEEVELRVDSFEKARDFLKSVGLIEKAYQETKRIRYVMKEEDVEFDIDTWPGLNPWIEIEAASKKVVKKYSSLLGFDWRNAMFGSADFVYEKVYKIDADWINNKCSILRFGDLPKELQESNLR